MNKNDLIDRTKSFAIRVFKLVECLPKLKASDVISYQLLKAASSVFWLTFIKDWDLLRDHELGYLIDESSELTAIFTKSVKTLSGG